MSQVLQFGFPKADWLLCDHPVCRERATMVGESPVVGSDKPAQLFGCPGHYSEMAKGRPNINRVIKLDTPGEWNKDPAKDEPDAG